MSKGLRLNGRELAILAARKGRHFDKEGVLQIREKQEGLFRKGEVYVERYFKLSGNLLFYFRTKDPSSEPVGLILMERCVVELDPEEDEGFSFILVFEGDDKLTYLAAKTERDRDNWIEFLHIASYECMQMQLQNLREQLRARTGRDPIDNPEPSVLPDNNPSDREDDVNDPFLEMCVQCEGLPSNSSGRDPDTFVSVHHMSPPDQQWVTHAHTEIVERSTSPTFLTTVGFSGPQAMALCTRVRLSVYDVKERMTNTMTQIGTVIFTIADLLNAPNGRLKLRINSFDMQAAGCVILMAWQNENFCQTWNGKATGQANAGSPVAAPRASRSNAKRMEMLQKLYENVVTKTYRFPTNCAEELSVHEYMAESKLTFYLPKLFLKLWVEEEKRRIDQLQNLGDLGPRLQQRIRRSLGISKECIDWYTRSYRYCLMNEGAPFKPSAKKGHKEVEFAPTNLHLQRVWVHNEAKKTSGCYDMMTCGAFTAYTQKYKHGGLRRMLRQLKNATTTADKDEENKLEQVNKLQNDITTLRDSIDHYCDEVCRAAQQADSADLNNCMAALSDKTRQLVGVCENSLIDASVEEYSESRQQQEQSSGAKRPSSGLLPATNAHRHEHAPNRASDSWKWSGTDFVKSPTVEPWDLTRLNTEAGLVCVVSCVEDLMRRPVDSSKWLAEVSQVIIKLRRCVEVMCGRARAGLAFLTLKEHGQNVPLMHTIKYRRDVVFSQAVTTATSAFMTKLRTSLTDETFLRQLFQIGILMQFESLLSCHGDEVGMLEDMVIGVDDLHHVVFKVTRSSGTDDIMPKVEGCSLYKEGLYPDNIRTGYTIAIPVPESMFQLLPREIQRGHKIKVIPALFNIGINEQQTLADRFGDTALQEATNADSYQAMFAYYEKMVDLVGEPECRGRNALPMDQLMRHLYVNVMSKKSKNVETLHLAAEACRKLNGIRFINCKSGKDRTSMSATLEQVQLLQREHDLAAHVFLQALDCMRSEGVRRDNTVKNSGARKYAFNSLQLLAFPKLYRPPTGTYGNADS